MGGIVSLLLNNSLWLARLAPLLHGRDLLSEPHHRGRQAGPSVDDRLWALAPALLRGIAGTGRELPCGVQ